LPWGPPCLPETATAKFWFDADINNVTAGVVTAASLPHFARKARRPALRASSSSFMSESFLQFREDTSKFTRRRG